MIIYKDEDYIILNKPAGMAVQGMSYSFFQIIELYSYTKIFFLFCQIIFGYLLYRRVQPRHSAHSRYVGPSSRRLPRAPSPRTSTGQRRKWNFDAGKDERCDG